MTKTITAELNDEQYKRYEILKDNGMDVGEAIDLLFNVRDQLKLQSGEYLENRLSELNSRRESLQDEMAKVDKELSILDKIADTNMDFEHKQQIIEKEYANVDETYEMKVQEAKRKVSWAKDFFKF